MGLLAQALGFTEPWLQQTPDQVIEEVLRATAVHHATLHGITLEKLQADGAVPLALEETTPFAKGSFPTPSGKVELFSETLAAEGVDPLPGRFREASDDSSDGEHRPVPHAAGRVHLLTGASHHFVSSSLASQPSLLKGEGEPFLEIHPADAAARAIGHGDMVIVENRRGWCRLRAVVTDAVRPGVVVSPKGRWCKFSGGRNVNWTTSDALADMAGQSTFHSNQVWLRRADD
jgi:anaerobic selenocysteine-containing dehydrogenase